MISSYEIYKDLEKLDPLKNSPKYWWPNIGTFEVVVGAILTQNTNWKNVKKSLINLKNYLTLDSFLTLNEDKLKNLIKPSGFYNQKAPRLIQLANNIKSEFLTFENFKKDVSREWLLKQKGIGQESADAILCYASLKPHMVVDSYTKRLLKNSYNIEFKTYKEYKKFLEDGIKNSSLKYSYETFAKFHGMIVEVSKPSFSLKQLELQSENRIFHR